MTRSKLFLSCDLTGSTAFKQREHDPQSPWQKVFLQFYREFPQTLGLAQAEPDLAPAADLSFDLWKPVGDELIFTTDVISESQIYWAIKAWLRAMELYQEESLTDHAVGLSKGPRLGVKGGAFVATFPGPDHESTIPRSPDIEVSGQDVVQLNQAALRGRRAHSKYLYDYFGPSIDTGFRVLSHCTARHFAVSLEVAFALASLHQVPGPDHYDMLDLMLYSSEPLKGVWGEKTYPLFAMDLGRTDPVNAALASFEEAQYDPAKILALCEACYTSDAWPFKLYLPEASNGHFLIAPSDPLAEYIPAEASTKGAEAEADDEPADAEEIHDPPLG